MQVTDFNTKDLLSTSYLSNQEARKCMGFRLSKKYSCKTSFSQKIDCFTVVYSNSDNTWRIVDRSRHLVIDGSEDDFALRQPIQKCQAGKSVILHKAIYEVIEYVFRNMDFNLFEQFFHHYGQIREDEGYKLCQHHMKKTLGLV